MTEYPVWQLAQKKRRAGQLRPAYRHSVHISGKLYSVGMGFNTKKAAEGYAEHHRRKGGKIRIAKAPSWVRNSRYGDSRYVSYERWRD